MKMGGKTFATIGVLLIAVTAAVALRFRGSRAAGFARLAWSRSPRCSLKDVWTSMEQAPRTAALADNLFAASRVIASEGSFELVETPRGRFWVPRGNADMLTHTMVHIDREVYGNPARGVRSGDIVLDCGANVGVYTRHALDRGARLVVAIEPAPENIYCLRRNFEAEIQAGRVIVYPKGVWDKEDELRLQTAARSDVDSVALPAPGSRPGPKVALTTIDHLVAELRLDRVDFIKMDVEGAERKALAGAARTVAQFRPRLAVSVEHLAEDVQATAAQMARLFPGLKVECGRCVWLQSAFLQRVQPEVLFAYR